MRTKLMGVHSVKARLKDGTPTVYHYHRASKTRLVGKPGSPEFLASLAAAEKAWTAALGGDGAVGTVKAAIARYKASTAYTGLAERTRADYAKMMDLIDPAFGKAKLAVFSDRRIRGDVLDWRDKIAARSLKTADMALTVLGLVVRHAKNRGELQDDHLAGMTRLYSADRADSLWTPEHVAAFNAGARPELVLAMTLASNTGQRQGDLLRLTWSAYDGEAIRLRQSKRGARLVIPCTDELKAALDAAQRTRRGLTILTDSRGMPWKGNGFRLAWGRRVAAAGLADAGLTFNDLRGTAVTALADAGCTEAEISAITGHSIKTAGTILKAYLSRTGKQASAAIAKLEQSRKRTDVVK